MGERRGALAFLTGGGLSQRRSCGLVGLHRSTARYPARPRDDAGLLERLKRVREKWPRFGYRRAWAVLRREGEAINPKRVYRLWRSCGLAVSRRKKRVRRKPAESVPCRAAHPNHVWTYDFLEDATLSGSKLRLLTVVDEFTRECLKIEVGTSFPAERVLRTLEGVFQSYGTPRFLRSDNGPEFIALTLRGWLRVQGAGTLYIAPGSPWENGYVESFNGKFRDECLDRETFLSVAEARIGSERYRRHYNGERPHSSLGYKTPLEFKKEWMEAHPTITQ